MAGDGESGGSNKRFDKDGRAEFSALPPGDYVVRIFGSKAMGEMRVTLPGPSEVRFEPRPQTALFVQLRGKDGYLATVGLQAGDIIIGADGEEFTAEKPPHSIRAVPAEGAEGAQPPEKTLIVIRGNQRLSITVDPTKLWGNPRETGGFLREIPR